MHYHAGHHSRSLILLGLCVEHIEYIAHCLLLDQESQEFIYCLSVVPGGGYLPHISRLHVCRSEQAPLMEESSTKAKGPQYRKWGSIVQHWGQENVGWYHVMALPLPFRSSYVLHEAQSITLQISDQPYFFQRLNGGELVGLTIVFGIHHLPPSFPLLWPALQLVFSTSLPGGVTTTFIFEESETLVAFPSLVCGY